MPKSRNKGGTKQAVGPPPPLPLLDSLRAQISPASAQANESDTEMDNARVSSSGWQCDIDDWSKGEPVDQFPQTLRSMERKTEQAKNRIFTENESQANRMNKPEPNSIDLPKLSSIISELLTGGDDQSAYTEFLSILQTYSIHSLRADHLEETVYHLIQSGVSFIRANEHRFAPSKLQECYYQRHLRRMNTSQ